MKTKEKKTKRNTVFNVFIVALFLICVSLLLYPYISGLFVSNAQKEVCVSHDNRTRELPEAEKKRLLADALMSSTRWGTALKRRLQTNI